MLTGTFNSASGDGGSFTFVGGDGGHGASGVSGSLVTTDVVTTDVATIGGGVSGGSIDSAVTSSWVEPKKAVTSSWVKPRSRFDPFIVLRTTNLECPMCGEMGHSINDPDCKNPIIDIRSEFIGCRRCYDEKYTGLANRYLYDLCQLMRFQFDWLE